MTSHRPRRWRSGFGRHRRVELDTSGTVDVDAERRRLEKDLAAAQKELAQTTAKLANDAFLAKAPATSSTRSATGRSWPARK